MLNTIIDGCPWCGVPKQHVPSNPNSLMQPALSSDLDSALQNILIEDFYKYSINPFCVLFLCNYILRLSHVSKKHFPNYIIIQTNGVPYEAMILKLKKLHVCKGLIFVVLFKYQVNVTFV